MTKAVAHQPETGRESCNFAQLDLDFKSSGAYIILPGKEKNSMSNELFATLDARITELLEKYAALKNANLELAEENRVLKAERETLKSGVDSILSKLEGI